MKLNKQCVRVQGGQEQLYPFSYYPVYVEIIFGAIWRPTRRIHWYFLGLVKSLSTPNFVLVSSHQGFWDAISSVSVRDTQRPVETHREFQNQADTFVIISRTSMLDLQSGILLICSSCFFGLKIAY